MQATLGNVSYVADALTHSAYTTTSGSAGSYVEVKPYTLTNYIEFSAADDSAGYLRLSSSELNFSTPMLKVGSTSHSVGISIAQAINPAAFSTLSLINGGSISQTTGSTITIANLNAHGDAGVTLNEANVVSAKLAGQSNGGSFSFTNQGDLTVDQVDVVNNGITASSGITLTSNAGAVSQGGSSVLSSSSAVSINAQTGITLNNNNLIDYTINLTNGTSGDISYVGTTTGELHASASNVGSGNISISASGPTLKGSSISAGSGNITLTGATDVLLNSVQSTSGNVNVTATNGSIKSYMVASEVGGPGTNNSDVRGNQVNFTAKAGIGEATQYSTDAHIQVLAGSGGVHATTTAAAKDVYLATTSGDMNVGTIAASGGVVNLKAASGGIVDVNGASLNITAAQASLAAYSGIGHGNALETNIASLSAANSGSSNIAIDNNAGTSLSLGTLSNVGGNWYIYVADPSKVTKNGLTSNFRHYGVTSGTYATPSESGNGFLYANTPTLTIDTFKQSGTASHTYGTNPTAVFNHTVSGLADAEDTLGNIGLTGTATYSAPTSLSNAGSYMVKYSSGLSASSGYAIAAGAEVNYTVDKAVLSFATSTTIADKVYDGATAAGAVSVGTLNGLVGSETLNVTGAAAALGSKNVGSYSTTVSYTLTDGTGLASNYTLATSTGVGANITAKALTVTGTVVANKVYDGNTTASLSGGSLVGVVGSETVVLTQAGTFADKNAGTAKVVTANDSISGADASNYTITQPTSLAANITAKALTVTGTVVANKVYDGNTTASLSGGSLVGVVGSETVVLTQAGTFADKNAGTAKVVTANDSISGADASNYTITQPTSLAANITAKALTVTGTVVANKVYDGNTTASLSGGSLVGVVGSETVVLTQAGTFADKNAGTAKVVTANDSISGADASNYTITQPTSLAANITAKALTVTGTVVANKVYDGNTTASLSGGSLVGVVGSETVVLTQAGTFADKNAGTAKVVTANDSISGADASNYTITQPTSLAANITAKALTVTGTTVQTRDFNNNTTATLIGGTLVGVVGSETVTLTQAGTFDNKNAGTGKAVTASDSISGADAGNYTIIQPTGLTGSITAKTNHQFIGATGGLWSVAANWDGGFVPETGNVLSVFIPATDSTSNPMVARYDISSLSLNSVNSDGTFKLESGALNVNSSLRTLKYEQVGGSLNGTGTVTVDQLFSKSGGSIDVSGKVKITQASGNLVVADVWAPTMQLTALSGSVSFTNTGATTAIVFEDTNGATGITIDNKGGVTLAGATRSTGGGVSVTARSPLVVTGTGIQAAGNVSLTTTNETSAGTMTVNAPVTSTGGGLTLSASGAYTQNSALSAAGGVSVSAASMSYGAGATTDGNPVSYTVGGASVAAPISKAVASSSVQAGSIVSDFLEKLDEAVEEQLALATTEDEEEKRRRAELEGQGEICLR